LNGATRAIERAWHEGGALATLLRPLGALNGALVAARAALYRSGRCSVVPSPLPVVVVGNLTVGGTGKSPLTGYLVEAFRRRGWRPGIVSRGHGGERQRHPRHVRDDDRASVVGDEPLMLRRATGAPVCVCVRRAAAVAALARDTDCDLVLSDDGLQHLAMARDAEIVVVDGETRFGNARLLPAGPMREPPERLLGADLIAVRSVRAESPVSFAESLADTGSFDGAALPPIFGFATVGARVRRWPDGRWLELETLRGHRVHALAGIGRPERFFETLRAAGLEVDGRPLPDHHVPEIDDLRFADELPVLFTAKDAVKLDAGVLGAAFAGGSLRASLYEVDVRVATDASADARIDALSARLRERAAERVERA